MRFHVTKFAWTRDTGIFSRVSLFIDFLINGNRWRRHRSRRFLTYGKSIKCSQSRSCRFCCYLKIQSLERYLGNKLKTFLLLNFSFRWWCTWRWIWPLSALTWFGAIRETGLAPIVSSEAHRSPRPTSAYSEKQYCKGSKFKLKLFLSCSGVQY